MLIFGDRSVQSYLPFLLIYYEQVTFVDTATATPELLQSLNNYKNLFLYTKMRNVAGLSTSDAQKSSDMFVKCRYMDEITGNRGVIFATGTPVSNSMTELYTCLLYTSRCV